jgi:hypothetical protein
MSHARCGDRIGETDEHHQPLGDQAHDTCGGCRHRLVQACVAVMKRIAKQGAQQDHQADERVQQSVDSAFKRQARAE